MIMQWSHLESKKAPPPKQRLGSDYDPQKARERAGSAELQEAATAKTAAFVESLRRCDFLSVVDNVADGVDFNCKDIRGRSPLMIVAAANIEGSVELVKFLLEAQAHPEARDLDGNTALMHACRNSNMRVVKRMLKSKAAINTRSNDGTNVLIQATIDGADELVKLLIASEADMHKKDIHGWTVLFHACQQDRHRLARWLLENHANSRDRARDGLSPLMLAAKTGNERLGKDLVKFNASPSARDKTGNSVLMMALRSVKRDFAIWLIDNGADVEVENKYGEDAATIANDVGLKTTVDYIGATVFMMTVQHKTGKTSIPEWKGNRKKKGDSSDDD